MSSRGILGVHFTRGLAGRVGCSVTLVMVAAMFVICLNSVCILADSLENKSRAVLLSSLILVERSLQVDSGRPYIIKLSLHQ